MPELLLTSDMIVREGYRVIAHEVESKRAKRAYEAMRRRQIRRDPLFPRE